MNYYLPTKVFFGKNAVCDAENDLKSIGEKALIVTGRSSAKKSGALTAIINSLDKLSIQYEIYAEIQENPSLISVDKGVELCKKTACDFIIGIGGGSPIDAGKAIAMIVASEIKTEEIYDASKFKAALPLVAVPLTSGTGTEATQYSVLTDTINKKKAGFGSALVFPKLSIVNPEFSYSVPRNVTLNTAIDALSHLLEGLYSKNRNMLVTPMLHKGVKLIIDNLETALTQADNYEARAGLMLGSLYGGIVIAHTGTTLQHSIGYPLTTEFGTPHGMANGIVMEDIMELYYPHAKSQLDELFDYLNMTKTDFYSWLKKFDLVLNEKLDEELIEYMTEKVMATRNMALNPLSVSTEQVKELYRRISK